MNFKDLPKIIMLIIALIGFVVILSNALKSGFNDYGYFAYSIYFI